jgi:membrane dipeptidase
VAVSTLQGGAVVVDTHNDLLLLVDRRPRAEQAAYFRERWVTQLRAGGVGVQVLPVCTPDCRSLVRIIGVGHRVADANSDVVALCNTGADIDAARDEGKIALVLAIESCEALGSDPGLLEPLFRLGIRMASFTHMGRTGFADGSAEDHTRSGLTRAGIEALSVMEELGILMDVSHLSAAGVDDVLERATRAVVASHSSAHALLGHHRNLTDERLKGIAATGGVIGVNFMAGFIDPDDPTVDRLVDHLLHIAAVAGIDHVGLGPDFIEEYAHELVVGDLVMEGVSLKQVIPDLGGPTGLPLVTDALLARDVPEGDIRKIAGENWLRVLRAELGVARESAPADVAAGHRNEVASAP